MANMQMPQNRAMSYPAGIQDGRVEYRGSPWQEATFSGLHWHELD